MLKQNATIGIIALGGTCEKELVQKAVTNIKQLGYDIKLSKNIYDKNAYLAGDDNDKIQELHNFFI